MGFVGMGTFVGRLGRLFLTYILIYQQIFLGCVWAQGGLRVIQADLHDFEHRLDPGSVSKPLYEPKVVFSPISVDLKEAFKGCHVVLRAEGEKVQALWRRGNAFYAFDHPELSACVRLQKEKGKNLLYIKSLLSGSGYQDFVIGVESSEGILLEDSLQLKQLIVQAPIILNRAMGFLNLEGTLEGIDVEKLDVYGQFKMESESTLNVKTLHLHHGTFINQGTVKFKEGGKAFLGGNDFINDHEIVGVKNLTFEKGGILDQRLASSQITLKGGRFLYEGLRLNFHEHSSLSAASILLKTSEDLLSLPRMTGDHLHLEAPYLEEGILKRVATFKTLKLISTRAGLTFSAPLSEISLLTLEAPQVTNKGGLGAKGNLYIKASTIVNEAPLLSKNGKVVLEGNVQHMQGLLGAYNGVEITGEKHTLLGEIHPHTVLTIKSQQGFTHDLLKFKTENVLKLVFQEPTIVPQAIDTPGVLILEGPAVTLKGSVQAQHLEARTSLLRIEAPSLGASLKAWGQVEVVASQFTAGEGIEVIKDLKITSSGPVVLKGAVVSNESITLVGQKIEAQQELFAHKKLDVESTGDLTFKERAVGVEGINLAVHGEFHYKEADQNVTAENSSLQTKGILRIVSQHPVLHLKHSLHLLGMLDLHAPLIHNQAILRANQGIQIEAPLYSDRLSIHNDGGYLLTDYGDIVLKGRVCHNSGGLIRSSRKVVIDGTIHNLCSKIIGIEGIEVHSQRVLNLVYQKDSFQTEGLLRLIFAQGGNIDRPLEVAGTVEIKLLPREDVQYLNLYTNLKAGRGLRFEAPGHAIVVGDVSLPFVELHSGGFFDVPTAQFFDLAHGGIFSDHFFHIKSDNRILLGNWLEETRTTRVKRNNGDYLKISHPYYTTNGSYCASNGGMKLETNNFSNNGGDILVMDKDLEIITQGYCYPISDLIEVWHGNASITSASFCQHMYNSAKCGDNISAPFWVNYMLPAARSSRLCVNGNIFFNVKKGESWSGSILASGAIFGKEFIQQKAYSFYFFSGLRLKSSNNAVSLVNNHIKYNQLPQLQGSQGVAFVGTKQALVQGRVVGSRVVIAFEDDLRVQTVMSGQPLTAFKPIMDLGSLFQSSCLVKLDSTGKERYLLTLAVPLKYPHEKELQEMDKLILGPLGSEKLRPFLHPLLEARTLLEALQQNIGYVPFNKEGTDFLALHLQLRRNGAEVMKILRPYLEQPALLGLPNNASPQALIAAGQSLLQQRSPSLPKELALNLSHPLIFDIPQVINNEKVLKSYLYTPLSYYNPKKCEHIAQMWAQELYLMGKEGSHLSLDKSRLMTEDKGAIVAGTLSLEKEIQYDCQTQQYGAKPGGEILGDTWEVHAENVISKLGLMDVKHLWLDVLNHYYTSGVTKADVLVCDVKQVTLDRKQRCWRVTYTIETTTKKKRPFGGSKKKTYSESHTVTLTDSYPAHLSGLLAFEKFIGQEGDARAWFPERQAGREIKNFIIQGGTVRAGQEGWSPQVQEMIKLFPKEETSLRYSETSCKGYSKRGMIVESTVVPAEVITEGPLHPVSRSDMVLVSPKITSSSDHVVFEAKNNIYLQEHSVFNQEDFHYFSRKDKIYEVERWQEVRTPIRITMPGKPVFRAGQEIKGEFREIQGCEEPVYEAPRLSLSRPILRDVSHERLIGMISKGVRGLDILAMVGTGILLFNPATTWIAVGLEVAKDSALAAIGGAMLTSVASQAVGSTVAHRGHLKQVGRDVFSKEMGITLLTCGGGSGGSLTFLQQAQMQATRAITRAGLNIAILGQKPREAFKEALTSAAVNTVAAYTAGKIGKARPHLNYLEHKAAHFVPASMAGLILSKGDVEKAITAGMAASLSEVIAEGLPTSLSREVRGNIAKIGTGLIAVLAQQDVGLAIYAACNAIENNFMTQEEDLLQRKKQEEEELAQVFAYLSRMSQAGQGVLQDMLSDDHPRTLGEVRAQREYQNNMHGWEDHADDFGGSYSTVGTLIEAKQKSENPSLRDLDTRGRERARQKIYPHRRSQSPPRLKTTVVEEGKETIVRVAKGATPESVKNLGRAMVPYVQKGLEGIEQGFIYVGDHVPGARSVGHVVKDITVGGLEFFDKTLDVMPTAMRRTARTLGLPQNWSQNLGDATHLFQDIVLIVMPAVKAIRMERATATVGEMVPAVSPLSLEVGSYFPYQAKAYLREMEQITGRQLYAAQRVLLKQSLQEKPYVKLSEADYKKHHYAFKNKKDNLIKKWEEKTGQTWPTYEADVIGKKHKPVKFKGDRYDAHEIIPNEYGGPLTWYNIHPARFPDQHQAGIHGKDSVLNKLLIQLESK